MSDEIRKQVSETYTNVVQTKSGCCNSGGSQAERIGYSTDELKDLPEDAVSNSFGCGNPLAFSEVKEGDVVLDLGSGAGIDVLIAARKVGPSGRAIGIDMTDEMLARARQNIAESGLTNAEVRQGIIEALPVEDASVDWITSNCVINLSPEKDRVFSEIQRVLKPGGRFSISDIVVEDMPAWLAQHMSLYSACISGAISEAEYVSGLADSGLEQIEISERIVYGASQLRALLESGEVPMPDDVAPELIEKALVALNGKVQSIKVQGRRPTVQ
jgi:SAM-dependent methyltransferase